ncbi:hypothetical protein [Streptomyces decoyicus]|uniref:hypothetical protein n=1 Tax=Streptomyces decoyicus TaxID=249567 RepID=UPI0033BDE4B0
MSALTHGQDDEAPDSLEEVIRRYVRRTIENHRDDPQLLRVMIEQAPRSPELLEKTSQYQQARTVYARGLIENHPEARVADMEVAARLLVSTVELVVHQLIAAPDPLGHRPPKGRSTSHPRTSAAHRDDCGPPSPAPEFA